VTTNLINKILVTLVLLLLLNSSSNAEETWKKDAQIYMKGTRQCSEVYAYRSGSYNEDDFFECVNTFKAMDNARIEARENSNKEKCEAARRKNANTKGSTSLSNAENFLLGVLGEASEDMACGY